MVIVKANKDSEAGILPSEEKGARVQFSGSKRTVIDATFAEFDLLMEDRMKYMMLIYGDEKAWDEDERQQCYVESTELTHWLKSKGQYLGASPLQPVATATTVRMRDGKRLVTDGPFAETREQLGGFFLIEAEDLDSAISIAGQIPAARKGTVEIRPVVEVSGLPTD